MEASDPFEYAFRQVTRTDTEGQQDSSDEESDKRNEATESAVNCFTEGAKRYLRDEPFRVSKLSFWRQK